MRFEDVNQYIGYYPPAYPYLRFVNGGVDITLINEEIISYNRSEITEKAITRTWGNTVIADTCKPDKHQWSLTLKLGISQSDKLIAIHKKSTKARKSRPTGEYIVNFHDVGLPIIEDSESRTKAINWLKTDNNMFKYFAVFSVIFNSFKYTPNIYGNTFEIEIMEV